MQHLSATIGEIYEAALNPQHWDVALNAILSHCTSPNWDVAFLLWEKQSPPFGRFLGASGVADYVQAGYLEHFAGRNLWSEKTFNLPIGQVIHSDELVARDEFKKTQLYKNFLQTWDMDTAIISTIDREGDARLGLVMPGPDNGSTANMIEILKLLHPHLRRACKISQKIGETSLRAKMAQSVLDKTKNAIMLLSDDFQIQYCNKSGLDLIGGGILEESRGRLRFASKTCDSDIRSFTSNKSEKILAINIQPEGKENKRALIMKIREEFAQTMTGSLKGASLMLIVNNEQCQSTQTQINLYRQWFDFTPAEARLAAALAQGSSLEQYAIERGVTINAARFLVRGLYHKTATNKQGQLVKVLHDMPSVFGNNII